MANFLKITYGKNCYYQKWNSRLELTCGTQDLLPNFPHPSDYYEQQMLSFQLYNYYSNKVSKGLVHFLLKYVVQQT